MSVIWFELPAPVELGEGWSMRPLTAAQMLACRGEGEAMAKEERDKALWANAQLLAQVLLKEGEAPFGDGSAVLEHLTAGQIEGLARRWWEQDDFSGPQRREEWTSAEGGENQGFDMARFLALGGADPAPAPVRAEPSPAGRSRPFWAWPGTGLPVGGRAVGVPDALPLLRAGDGGSGTGELSPSRADRGVEEAPIPEEHRMVRLPEGETVPAGEGLTLDDIDRAVERDARRYDGPSTFY